MQKLFTILLVFFLSTFILMAIPVSPGTVYVNSSYCSGCGNDGHTWNWDAFDNLENALSHVADNGKVIMTSDITFSGSLTLSDGVKIFIGDYDLTITGSASGDENSYIVCTGEGRVRVSGEPPVFYPIGTETLYRPMGIDAESGYTYSVNITSWAPAPPKVFWDVKQYESFQPDDTVIIVDVFCFMYDKEHVPDYENLENTSYVYHFNDYNWENLTPGGATTSTWEDDEDYYQTCYYMYFGEDQQFSPFTILGEGGIPTMTEWATIILGSLFVIAGGWFVWRRIT